MHSATLHPWLPLLPFGVIAALWLMAFIERRRRGVTASGFVQRNGAVVATYLVVAVGVWMLLMIVLPQLSMLELSFRPKLPPVQMGGPRDVYTLENYRYFLFGSVRDTGHWNVTHLRAFGITILVSILVTGFDLALCYPLAFYMAQSAKPARLRLLLLLLVAPYWVNEILRAFAWRIIFSASGLLNTVLLAAGAIGQPIDFLGHDIGLYTGLSYAYLLLMIFPLYNAIESLPHEQIEAARDLGAPWWRIHRDIVVPFAKPGVASGCTLVFMLSAGALATPQILGGPRSLWFTPIVYDRFYQAFNWPLGAAYAFILLLTCVAFVLAVLRLARLSFGEMTR
ncbi:MAG TPA: ABC transporter permease [Acetobacteraceae bacterium]|nr:ABC transporter permease [Acetobacteraceae bacterium]